MFHKHFLFSEDINQLSHMKRVEVEMNARESQSMLEYSLGQSTSLYFPDIDDTPQVGAIYLRNSLNIYVDGNKQKGTV